MPVTEWIDVSDHGGVTVVTFRERRLFEDRVVRESFEQINAALASDGTPIRLCLDFAGVEIVSSSLLGKIIVLQRRIDGTKGKLRLCEMGPNVEGIFKTSNLDRLFSIDRDRRESLQSLGAK